MRHSTQAEKDDYEAMLKRKSTVLVASEEFERLKDENERLRELIYDIIVDEERGHDDDMTFREHVIRAHEHGIAQDIEVH